VPGPMIQFATLSSQPIAVGDLQITVRSRALQVRFPGASGGVIWNRPIAVSVYQPDGAVEHLPVRDVTRLMQVAFLACALLAFVMLRGKHAGRGGSSRHNYS
jgi:hypothetical protein